MTILCALLALLVANLVITIRSLYDLTIYSFKDIRLKVKNNGVIKTLLDILWIYFVRRTSCGMII